MQCCGVYALNNTSQNFVAENVILFPSCFLLGIEDKTNLVHMRRSTLGQSAPSLSSTIVSIVTDNKHCKVLHCKEAISVNILSYV